MALPGALTTVTVSFGPYTDAEGAVALVGAKGKLFPVDPATGKRLNLVHVATGQEIIPSHLVITVGSDGTDSVGPIPHTDNAGLSTVGFAYRVEWDIASNKPSPGNKTFAVPAASGATVDFDLLDVAAAVPGVLVPIGTGPQGPTGPTGPQGPAGTSPTIADASASIKGVVQLAGDLGGTAAAPTVPGLAGKVNSTDPRLARAGVPGRRIAALGDSITAGIIGAVTPNANNVLQGSYLMYGVMQSAGRLEWGGLFGVPGQTTQQILARVGDVIAAAPDACVVLTGANDPDLPTYATYLPQIVNALVAAGIEPILASRPPSSAVYASNLGVHRVLRAINGWVSDYATENGYRFVDFFADLVDPVTGLYKAGHNSDITHPNETGYRVMGTTLADALVSQVEAGWSWIVTDPLDETGYTSNPLFLNGTGGVPSGWYVAAAGTGVTASFVSDDPDFLGRAVLTQCTDGSTRAIQQDIGNADWNFQPGDRVAVSCKITTVGLEAASVGLATNNRARVTISVPNNSKTSGPSNLLSWQVGADIKGGVIYFEDVIPPGTNGASIQLRNDGGNGQPFSYKIGQFSVRSLNRLMGA